MSIVVKACVKITFDAKGGVSYEINLGATVDKKTGNVVLTRRSVFQMVEEACIYARLYAIRDMHDRKKFKKEKRARDRARVGADVKQG